MEELELEEETIIYAALDVLYTDLESGLTLTEALEVNADLYDAIEMSKDLYGVIDDIIDAIIANSTVEDAFAEYEDDLEIAVTNAASLITDVAIEILGAEVTAKLLDELLQESLDAIYDSLEDGETLEEAIAENSGFEEMVTAYTTLEAALEELEDAIADGISIGDAIDLYGDAITAAAIEAEIAMGEDDDLLEEQEALLATCVGFVFDALAQGISITDALETSEALRAAIAVSSDLGHAVDNLLEASDAGATLSEAE